MCWLESLTIPRRNYNTKMEVTPVRDCYCLIESNSSTDLWSRRTHTFDLDPEAEKHKPLIPILRWEESFNLDHTSTGSVYKYIERFSLSLHVLAFLGHLFLYWHGKILLWDPACTGDWMRHPSLWSKKLTELLDFLCITIVWLSILQSVNHSSKLHTYINSMSSVTLENTDTIFNYILKYSLFYHILLINKYGRNFHYLVSYVISIFTILMFSLYNSLM